MNLEESDLGNNEYIIDLESLTKEIENRSSYDISLFQSAKTIGHTIEDPRRKNIEKSSVFNNENDMFTFYMYKDTEELIPKAVKRYFPKKTNKTKNSDSLDSDHLADINRRIISTSYLNNPSYFLDKSNRAINSLTQSIIESSPLYKSKKDPVKEKKIRNQITEKLSKIVNNVALSESEKEKEIKDFLKYVDEMALTVDVDLDFNKTQPKQTYTMSQKFDFLNDYIKSTQSLFKDIQKHNNQKGDKDVERLNKKINENLKELDAFIGNYSRIENLEEKEIKEIKKAYIEFISRLGKRDEENIDKSEKIFLDKVGNHIKGLEGAKQFITKHKQLQEVLENKHDNMNLSKKITEKFFDYHPSYHKTSKINKAPHHFFSKSYGFTSSEDEMIEKIKSDKKDVEVRINELLHDKEFKKELEKSGFRLNSEEYEKTIKQFGQIIETKVIDNEDSEYESLLKNRIDNVKHDIEEANRASNIIVNLLKDEMYNSLEHNTSIDVFNNLRYGRYEIDDVLIDRIEGKHNFDVLLDKVGQDKISANDAKVFMQKHKEFSSKMDSELYTSGKEMLTHLKESKQYKKNGSLNNFIKNTIESDRSKIEHDTSYEYKREMVREIMLKGFEPNSINDRMALYLGNKMAYRELETCASRAISSREMDTSNSMVQGCIEKFEQTLKQDTEALKNAIMQMSSSPIAAVTPTIALGLLIQIVNDINTKNLIYKRHKIELDLIDVVNHIKEEPDPKKKKILSAIYCSEKNPYHETEFVIDREAKENLRSELVFQEMQRTGRKSINFENKELDLKDINFSKGNTGKIIASIIKDRIDEENSDFTKSELYKELKEKPFLITKGLDRVFFKEEFERIEDQQEFIKDIKKALSEDLKELRNDSNSTKSDIELAKELLKENSIEGKTDLKIKLMTHIEKLEGHKRTLDSLKRILDEKRLKEGSVSIVDSKGNIREDIIEDILKNEPSSFLGYITNLKSLHNEKISNKSKKEFYKKTKNNRIKKEVLQKISYLIIGNATYSKEKGAFSRDAFDKTIKESSVSKMKQNGVTLKQKERELLDSFQNYSKEKKEEIKQIEKELNKVLRKLNYEVKGDILSSSQEFLENIKNENKHELLDIDIVESELERLKSVRLELNEINKNIKEINQNLNVSIEDNMEDIEDVLTNTSVYYESTMKDDEIKATITSAENVELQRIYAEQNKTIKNKDSKVEQVKEFIDQRVNINF